MGQVQPILWSGISGKTYKFFIYPLNSSLNDEPGNYIFARRTRVGLWIPCYIGETDNLKKHLPKEIKETAIKRYGATTIHAHVNLYGATEMKKEEDDLIQLWKPLCNEELRSDYQDAYQNRIWQSVA